MNTFFKVTGLIALILSPFILIFTVIGCIIVFIFFTLNMDSHITLDELKTNFELKKKEIYELKRYFNSIIPPGEYADIEFDNDKKTFRFEIANNDTLSVNQKNQNFSEWDLEVDSPKADSIIKRINWDRETFHTLKRKMDAANCISIRKGEPSYIGYKREGLGKYYFVVHDKPMSDKLKSEYNQNCEYYNYNDYVVFRYGGGAIGPQCFPEKKDK